MLFHQLLCHSFHSLVIASFGSFEYPLADRYRFDSILGRGGMGIVYRATDLRLGRAVAIKILHATLTSEIGIKRFQSEIHICARLHHPNIVTVYDCGEVDGRLYFVMEHLDGESLRVRLGSGGRLPVRESITIAEQIAAGLQYAHDNGVIHRDIKPENILLADGSVSIVDFGLARVFNDAAVRSLTDTGVVVGTPPYLSPEQANAEKQIGPGADQYALACVLFELLVGETPFVGRSAISIAIQHMKDTPPSLRARRPDVAGGISDAIDRALKKRPDERFGSIREFAYAVSDASRAVPQASNDTTRTHRSRFMKAFKSYWAR